MSNNTLTPEQIEDKCYEAYPALQANPAATGASQDVVDRINRTMDAARNLYRVHLSSPIPSHGITQFIPSDQALHNHIAGIPIPETEPEIHQFRERVINAMHFYADQFRITPSVEELTEIDKILLLMNDFSDPKQLHEARDEMYALRHLIRNRRNISK